MTSQFYVRTQETRVMSQYHTFYDDGLNPEEQKVSCLWECFKTPLQKLGEFLRNQFYLPLYQRELDDHYVLDQNLASHVCSIIKRPEKNCSKELEEIHNHFTLEDKEFKISGPIARTFKVRVFEPKNPSQDKMLRVILFSFYGNREISEEVDRRWEPLTISDLSHGPLNVLKALKTYGIHVDSLMTTSLGNVTYEGLKSLDMSQDFIPLTWISNRGLTSIDKVVSQQFSFPKSTLLHKAAQCTDLNANPEKEMLDYLNRRKESEKDPTDVFIIEAREDSYFSKKGAFSPDFHKKIAATGSSVFRASFYPFPFHTRSHHALSLDHLKFNFLTERLSNTLPFSTIEEESVANFLAREVFLKTMDKCHTCFYVCGNDATIDLGTAREIVPLLTAFLEESQKMIEDRDIAI